MVAGAGGGRWCFTGTDAGLDTHRPRRAPRNQRRRRILAPRLCSQPGGAKQKGLGEGEPHPCWPGRSELATGQPREVVPRGQHGWTRGTPRDRRAWEATPWAFQAPACAAPRTPREGTGGQRRAQARGERPGRVHALRAPPAARLHHLDVALGGGTNAGRCVEALGGGWTGREGPSSGRPSSPLPPSRWDPDSVSLRPQCPTHARVHDALPAPPPRPRWEGECPRARRVTARVCLGEPQTTPRPPRPCCAPRLAHPLRFSIADRSPGVAAPAARRCRRRCGSREVPASSSRRGHACGPAGVPRGGAHVLFPVSAFRFRRRRAGRRALRAGPSGRCASGSLRLRPLPDSPARARGSGLMTPNLVVRAS